MANGVRIIGVDFEVAAGTGGDGIHIHSSDATDNLAGPQIIGCRAEGLDNFLNLTGITTLPSVPPYLAGNKMISNVTNYINNPNNLYYTSLDSAVTLAIITPQHIGSNGVLYRAIAVNQHGMRAQAVSNGYGYQLINNSGTESGTWGNKSGGGSILKAPVLSLVGVNSISGSSTESENLRGNVTLSSGSASVSFGTAEPDASYFIWLSSSTNGETFSWGSPTTGGFTINSSNGSSTAVVYWLLIR